MGLCCMSCGALVEQGIPLGSWRDDYESVTSAQWAAAYAPIYDASALVRALAHARGTLYLRNYCVTLAKVALAPRGN